VKVLHVINTLGGGGAEMNVVRLAQYADRARVQCHLAYCGTWPLEAAISGCGLATFRMHETLPRVKSLATPRIIARLLGYIHKHKIDVVHTHLFNAHAWGAVAARLARVKVLEHVHDHRYIDWGLLVQRGLPQTRQYDRAPYLAKLSHRIVVLTNQNREYVLERVGICASKVLVIPNGLPPRGVLPNAQARAALRRQLNIPQDAIVVLGVGRLADEKNFAVFISAMELLRGEVPGLRALILGEGPARASLQRQIDHSGLTCTCQLAGYRTDVQTYYDSADMFVQPSLVELQSLAMLEAMQAGLPVMVSQGVGCNDELLTHADSGFLLHPNRPALWAECIRTLARQPAVRARVGEKGKALVNRQCDIRYVSRRFETLYEALCKT
jgi:glycosyltransferase involved in cell wall biosynthesis